MTEAAEVVGIVIASLLAGTIFTYLSAANRKSVAELKHTVIRLNQAQRVGRIGDWEYDPRSDEILWSEYLSRFYERGKDELRSPLSEVLRYVNDRDADRITGALAEVMRTGEEQRYELDVTLPSGAIYVRSIVATPKRDVDGAVIGVFGTDQDITQERHRERLQVHLNQVGQVESTSFMAATLAHEMVQPLTAAFNILAVLRHSLQPESDRPAVLQNIRQLEHQLEDISGIISEARSLVSSNAGDGGETGLLRAINDAATMAGPVLASASAELEIDAAGLDVQVKGTNAQLRNVFFNLFKNAVEASSPALPTGVKLKVEMHRAGGGQVEVFIKDDGTGFATDSDPFSARYSTKVGGLGLGLAICRTMIEGHGGRIRVNNSSSAGSTISVSMRLADSPSTIVTG